MKTNNKTLITEARLSQALERLVQGEPKNTKPDGRINLKRINDEAGLSSGSIYYYKEFIEKAREVIAELKSSNNKNNYSINQGELAKLRSERDKQKELKIRYRDQRDTIKNFADGVVHENAKLHFSLYEAKIQIEQLEKELTKTKVTAIPRK